jgi:hypothetical protein
MRNLIDEQTEPRLETGNSQIPAIPVIIDCRPISGEISIEQEPLKWVDDTKEGFQESPEGVLMMRQHYLDMMNPERLYTSAPLQEEYKRVQIEKAEQFLVSDGFKIIERGEIAPGLFG